MREFDLKTSVFAKGNSSILSILDKLRTKMKRKKSIIRKFLIINNYLVAELRSRIRELENLTYKQPYSFRVNSPILKFLIK